jgi:hypothetical protein
MKANAWLLGAGVAFLAASTAFARQSDRLSEHISVQLPNSVKSAAAELAKLDNVSLNQFIAAAVGEKVRTLRTASEFLKGRAGISKPKDLTKYLRGAPKVAPVDGDKLK